MNWIRHANKPNGFNINQFAVLQISFFTERGFKAEEADIGFAFDGDDRLIIVDDSGAIVDGGRPVISIAKYMQNPDALKGGVVGTVTSNIGLEIALNKLEIPF